ncbi:MAG: J domain-containing protein [Fibrobacteria bacterium]|nr:J domain-containing protein [Fibrobacteria bacterium]
MGSLLEEISRIEEDVAYLEQTIPPLRARLDAAVVPLLEEIVVQRKEMLAQAQRVASGPSLPRSLRREADQLVHHLAADLEERFGVAVDALMGEVLPEEDPDSADDFDWADQGRRAAWDSPPPPPRRNPRPTTPESAAKDIYRNLARELHPDKARDASQREDRTRAMQELTVAWGNRDLGTLLRLLHVHGSEETKADSLEGASLQACLQGLQARWEELRSREKMLRHRGLPEGAVDWMLLAKEPKVFERLLRKRRAPVREELQAVLQWKAQWLRPGGLADFLGRYAPQEWERFL